MKALSIQQPWAWAIIHAGKDIENRSWPTNFRGPIWIHAGKKIDTDGYIFLENMGLEPPEPHIITIGGIVGMVEIIGCTTQSKSKWFFGPFGFELRNARSVCFSPLRGQLGFFEVNK